MNFGIFERSSVFSIENCILADDFALTSGCFAVLVLETHNETTLNSHF